MAEKWYDVVMSIEKHLGKISSVKFGLGGYQDACIGLSLDFSFDRCCGVSNFKGAWSPSIIECDEHTEWTEKDRDKQLVEMIRFVDKLLHQAKVENVTQLKGIPVEITLDGNMLKDWRILTEVL